LAGLRGSVTTTKKKKYLDGEKAARTETKGRTVFRGGGEGGILRIHRYSEVLFIKRDA